MREVEKRGRARSIAQRRKDKHGDNTNFPPLLSL
jgi:hypothetical protein